MKIGEGVLPSISLKIAPEAAKPNNTGPSQPVKVTILGKIPPGLDDVRPYIIV
jgi:hypothetical protein